MTDNRYDQLPYPYKLFIDNYMNYNPDKSAYRDYYIFVSEEAVKIHEAVKDQAQLELLQDMSDEEVIERVPTLSAEHSSESLELARTMALVYRVNQERLGNYEWVKKNLPLDPPPATLNDTGSEDGLAIDCGQGGNLYMFYKDKRLNITVDDSYGFIGVTVSDEDVEKIKDFISND